MLLIQINIGMERKIHIVLNFMKSILRKEEYANDPRRKNIVIPSKYRENIFIS